MSWLLVAFIPGLLMLATFGLDRLEAGLHDTAISPAEVDEVLERAKADCAKTPPRAPVYETADDGYLLLDSGYQRYVPVEPTRDLPTRVFVHHRVNPEFQGTPEPFRV